MRHEQDGFMLEVGPLDAPRPPARLLLDPGLDPAHLAPGLLSQEACAGLVLDYHPLYLFDSGRHKEWRLLPPKPVLAVKARAAVAAQS